LLQALRKRKQLFHHPEVRSVLARFWETYSKGDSHTLRTQADHAKRQQQQSDWSSDERSNYDQTIQMHEYIDVHMKMAKALRKQFDYHKAYANALADWERDTQGLPSKTGLTHDKCFESIFEIADLWTPTVDVKDYVEFLER